MEMEMEKNEENKSTEEKQTGSICGYNSLQHLLSENLNPHLYKAVKFSADKELLREPRVEFACKYNMAIVSSILERDINHGETVEYCSYSWK
ncbi:hypothetical protein V6N11_033933 [Hibiscus sabdariffa]|uniref:Uncharacterized protein n=1 Tax=Hibiscus sabdariffa TaxID=183260 RepID=A0ABR2S0X2_9ROSI